MPLSLSELCVSEKIIGHHLIVACEIQLKHEFTDFNEQR